MFWNLSDLIKQKMTGHRKQSSILPILQRIMRFYDISIVVYFLICNSCLWCATYFGIDNLESLCASQTHALSCHICNSCNTKLLPISADVSSGMEYDVTSGMEMEFYRTNNVIDRRQSGNELHQMPVYF